MAPSWLFWFLDKTYKLYTLESGICGNLHVSEWDSLIRKPTNYLFRFHIRTFICCTLKNQLIQDLWCVKCVIQLNEISPFLFLRTYIMIIPTIVEFTHWKNNIASKIVSFVASVSVSVNDRDFPWALST